jgi:DNA-binding transcriptional ArsR family regulator
VLEALLESPVKEKILLFIYANGESYPREIAREYSYYINTVQYQLLKLEAAGLLYSKLRGKVRLFGFNPRYPFRKELESLLEKALRFYPESEKAKHYMKRRRPRRTGKPL